MPSRAWGAEGAPEHVWVPGTALIIALGWDLELGPVSELDSLLELALAPEQGWALECSGV